MGPVGGTSANGWKIIGTGVTFGCGIKQDNKLWCWGDNNWGNLAIGPSYDTAHSAVPSTDTSSWKTISVRGTISCAIRFDDTLWCWGNNYAGQLGVGDLNPRDVPTEISGGGSWKYVGVGEESACGIKANDTLWCWGAGSEGTLGNGANADEVAPVVVSGGAT